MDHGLLRQASLMELLIMAGLECSKGSETTGMRQSLLGAGPTQGDANRRDANRVSEPGK